MNAITTSTGSVAAYQMAFLLIVARMEDGLNSISAAVTTRMPRILFISRLPNLLFCSSLTPRCAKTSLAWFGIQTGSFGTVMIRIIALSNSQT